MADIFQIVENNGTPKDIGDSKARANIGEPFSASKNYAIGDECLYEGILYKFTSAHNAGTWNSSHVTRVNLADDKVNKSGDTITGVLNIDRNSSNVGAYRTTWSAYGLTTLPTDNNQYIDSFLCLDKYNNRNFLIRNHIYSDGSTQTDLKAMQSNIFHGVNLKIANNGTRTVAFDEPSAWRNALELSDSGWQSLTNNTKFSGTIYYRKIGKMVEVVAYQITLASALSSASVVLAQLPSGYRPSYNTYGSAGINNSYGGNILIYTNGEILFSKNYHDTSISTTQNIYFNSVFFIS